MNNCSSRFTIQICSDLTKRKRERFFFVLSRAWDEKKILSPHEETTSDLQISRSDAVPLSLGDSVVSEAHYMTRVPHTARISYVDSVMFVNRTREMGSFGPHKEIEKDVFRLVTSVRQRKKSFLIFVDLV